MSWLFAPVLVAVSGLLARLMLPRAIRLGHRYELLDFPRRHKRHKRPVPVLGGPVLFICFWACMVVAHVLFPDLLSGYRSYGPYVLAGSLIILLVGLSDDLAPVSAWTKLFAQVAAAYVLITGGLKIDPITVPLVGSVETGLFGPLITIVWVVGLSNAVNIIDGLDGLASGVSLVAVSSLAAVAAFYGDPALVAVAFVLIGFLVVFLYYNRYPARIFLGDSGALQLGFYFAVMSLLVPIRTYTAAALYLPLVSLGVPILEAFVSVSRRLIAGKNVLKADRRHLFHYLALAGLSPRRIVVIFYIVSVCFGLFTVAALYLDLRWVFGFLALFMVVIFVAFYIFMTSLSRPKR
ncbi:MAG: undecaprenyl/decaprenyl-phosphate alpha-N-acetylglucosaminyl 1-phosphate transferase [Candidatus Zixiibacteriota bacterium]|nr:MAG: undecaprenyl/decaprenyl-phosphate alpha-N-acetylglucosaminyl 1-phosphate transferase [candidate division Zixibacteria bacterium]